jgi:hypothetical protein
VRSTRITQARWIAARPRVGTPREITGPSIGYRAGQDGWSLWWPCQACGGVQLPLMYQPGIQGGIYDLAAVSARLQRRRCPACETARRRAASRVTAPAVWFDTELGDWVLALPNGADAGVLLPLEIHGFDAPEVVVYRAASDIVHSGDVFES